MPGRPIRSEKEKIELSGFFVICRFLSRSTYKRDVLNPDLFVQRLIVDGGANQIIELVFVDQNVVGQERGVQIPWVVVHVKYLVQTDQLFRRSLFDQIFCGFEKSSVVSLTICVSGLFPKSSKEFSS